MHMTGELSQRQEDKTLLRHLRRSNRNINLNLRSFFFFSLPYSLLALAYCAASECTHKLWVRTPRRHHLLSWECCSLSSATKSISNTFFLHFFFFTLCSDISAQFLLIPFCSNHPPCSGTFNCLLGHRYLKVNHGYVVQNFLLFLSY